MNIKDKPWISLSDDIPLRGALKCHCGTLLTGAPSRGRHGGYYYYYKCQHNKHNNISAKRAHAQIHEIFELMSVPKEMARDIKVENEKLIEQKVRGKSEKLRLINSELEKAAKQLASIEDKYRFSPSEIQP